MDPRQSCTDVDEEVKLQQIIEWYDECNNLIYSSIIFSGNANDIDKAREIKRVFLSCVDIASIENYLAFYKPIKINVSKLYTILDCAYAVQCNSKNNKN